MNILTKYTPLFLLTKLLIMAEWYTDDHRCTASGKRARGEHSGDSSGEDSVKASGKASRSSKLKEKPSNKDAFLALKPIANKWKTIGTLLELPSGKLDSIQAESHRDNDRMREMVVEWLKTLDATWEDLITAVKEVDEARALQIKKYGVTRE